MGFFFFLPLGFAKYAWGDLIVAKTKQTLLGGFYSAFILECDLTVAKSELTRN